MFDLFLTALVFGAGYAASIYTWPALRTAWSGAAKEAANLRQRALDLESKLRSTF